MDLITFSAMLYAIIVMGLVSLVWVSSASRVITDDLLKRLFNNLMALIIIALAFSFWLFAFGLQETSSPSYRTATAISLVALFALIIWSAFSAKRVGQMYGFAFSEKKRVSKATSGKDRRFQ